MGWFRQRKSDGKSESDGEPTGESTREPSADERLAAEIAAELAERTGRSDEAPAAPGDPARAAEHFWRRWHEMLPAINAALGDREPHRVEHDLCELIADVHPDLQFSLDRGHEAIYALVITGQEDPRLRPYTDAWRAAAPPNDVVWEYHDSVPPVPDPTAVTVNLGGHQISLADVRVVAQVDEAAGLVDVAVYHPELSELDENSRAAMTFLPLDATLGERVAAERLRRVESALAEPDNAVTLLDLRALVSGLAGGQGPQT